MDIVNDDNVEIKDVDESVIFKGISLNKSKKRNVEGCVDSNKSAKLVIETGIWSCNYTYCNIEDNDDGVFILVTKIQEIIFMRVLCGSPGKSNGEMYFKYQQ